MVQTYKQFCSKEDNVPERSSVTIQVFPRLPVRQSLDLVVIERAHEIIKLFNTISKQKHEKLVLSDVVCVLSELNIILISDVNFQILAIHYSAFIGFSRV